MNKQKIIMILSLIASFCTFYVVISCAWVGAEYIIDGAVHPSHIDTFIATLLAYFFTKEMYCYERKCRRKAK